MKNLMLILLLICFNTAYSQDNIYPATPQKEAMAITNATIHVGNGQVINNGTIVFDKGKITYVGPATGAPASAQLTDVKGKHVYPGLIMSNSQLGLVEVGSGTRATNDFQELGEYNPNIRSIVAYNTDSRVINTLRTNGILLAHVAPQGDLISGSSSVVQLDAWNWEDAAYKMENGIHFNMPTLINRPNPFAAFLGIAAPTTDPVKQGLEQIENVKKFFREAKAYLNETNHTANNLKYEAVKNLFTKKQKFFVHADLVKEMLVAVDFVKEFGFDVVIVGGSDSYLMADLLKQHGVAVILSQAHNLPTLADDDVDQPYKTAAQLQKAGVLFALNDDDGQTRGRNLAFNAGTAAAYGMSKEEALSSITLNAARILGIADKTGSLEVGKDANIVISEGDILDMKSSIVTQVYIQGRTIDMNDKHKQLYERYKHKYGIK
jgi:imidazolonepropionase-like amidohydrolase